MKYILYIILLTPIGVRAQAPVLQVEERFINYTNGKEVFHILKQNPSISFHDSLEYYWFNEYSGIKTTMGGCGGKLLHGKLQFFDKDGQLISENNFDLGLKHGLERTWNKNNTIHCTRKYKRGELVYLKDTNNTLGGHIEWIGPLFAKGAIKNLYDVYGDLVQSAVCFNFNSYKVTDYYPNKKIKRQFFFDNRDYNGIYIEYFENGQKSVEGKYDNGYKVGQWKSVNLDGSVVVESYRKSKITLTDETLVVQEILLKGEWVKHGKGAYYTNDNVKKREVEFEYDFELELIKE